MCIVAFRLLNSLTSAKGIFFNQSLTFPCKIFRSRFDPKHGYKTVNKSSQKSVGARDCELRESLRVIFQTTEFSPSPETTSPSIYNNVTPLMVGGIFHY